MACDTSTKHKGNSTQKETGQNKEEEMVDVFRRCDEFSTEIRPLLSNEA